MIIYSNGIDRTAYPSKRPSFNQWMRYVKLQNYKYSK